VPDAERSVRAARERLRCIYETYIHAIIMFDWDENKRLRTLEDRGVDLADAKLIFDGRATMTVSTRQPGEARFLTTGLLYGKAYTIVWRWREQTRRIFSFRRARKEEARAYRSLHG